MDAQQARKHLSIFNKRVSNLKQELEGAFKGGKAIDDQIKRFSEGAQQIEINRCERTQELESRYTTEINEHKKQLKLAEEVLEKKKDERKALMNYLDELDLEPQSFGDFREFDWESLQRMAENMHKPKESLVEQRNKAEELEEMIQDARRCIDELYQILSPTESVRARLCKTVGEFKSHYDYLTKILLSQEKRVAKVQCDNERLNILIRQCISTSEPMSDYVTKNVQAKCQAFVQSDNSQELVDGLRKFKTRQDRIIKLLQYKDKQLGSEINKLEVAKDQTHDQVKFYLSIIADKRQANLNSEHTLDKRAQLQSQTVTNDAF